MRAHGAGCTSVGRVRTNNEDCFQILGGSDLFLLADGMGAHAAGEVASRIAVETIAHYLTDQEATWPVEGRSPTPAERLVHAVNRANARVFESARTEPKWRDMGTTVVALQVVGDSVQIAHVGDSRAYRWRNGILECLTRDHTLAAESPGQFERYASVFGQQRLKSILTRAVGVEHAIVVDSREEPARAGDRYLLCSDGLTGMVEDDEIAAVLARDGRGAQQVCQALVDRANQLGGRDNITVIVVDLIDPSAASGRR